MTESEVADAFDDQTRTLNIDTMLPFPCALPFALGALAFGCVVDNCV